MAEIILDSGAYTAFRKGTPISIDKYAEFVKTHGSNFFGAFTLDSIGDAKQSYHNWKYLKDAGVDTIPVFHLGTDERWLKKYLKQTNYIGIGAIANLDTKQRLLGLTRIWDKYLTDPSGEPICKVHGLGLTALEIVTKYPWYSVDSNTPVISAAYGSILLPNLMGPPDVMDAFLCKVSDQGTHQVGMGNSFTNLPMLYKNAAISYFESHGFALGDLYYKEVRPRRRHKNKNSPGYGKQRLLSLKTTPIEEKRTLANNWEVRLQWNVLIWNEIINNLPYHTFGDGVQRKTKIYIVCSNPRHMATLKEIAPKPKLLISYACINDNYLTHIKKYHENK